MPTPKSVRISKPRFSPPACTSSRCEYVVTQQMHSAHRTRFVEVGARAFQPLATLLQEPLSARTANSASVAIDGITRVRVVLPVATTAIRLRAPRSKWDVYWGVLALRDLGAARSISVLKSLIHYPMQDVKDCAVLTIAHIAGASETPFFLEALEHNGSQKAYAMWAIAAAADERALSPVIGFVNTALRKRDRRKGR